MKIFLIRLLFDNEEILHIYKGLDLRREYLNSEELFYGKIGQCYQEQSKQKVQSLIELFRYLKPLK